MDARKWFELAKKIAKEQGGRAFDDCDNWLGLVSLCSCLTVETITVPLAETLAFVRY